MAAKLLETAKEMLEFVARSQGPLPGVSIIGAGKCTSTVEVPAIPRGDARSRPPTTVNVPEIPRAAMLTVPVPQLIPMESEAEATPMRRVADLSGVGFSPAAEHYSMATVEYVSESDDSGASTTIYSQPVRAISSVKRRAKKAPPDEGEQEEIQVVDESSAQAAGEEGEEAAKWQEYALEGETSAAEGAQDVADDVEIDYDAAKEVVGDDVVEDITPEQGVQNAADHSQEGHDHLKQLVEAEVNEQLTSGAFWFSPGGDAQQRADISALEAAAGGSSSSSSSSGPSSEEEDYSDIWG